MKAFLFPGQASQYVGMGKDLYNEFDIARAYFDRADEILQLNLKEICFDGPETELVKTKYTQPAIYVHSVINDFLLKDAGFRPDMAAGHSLGEYSALVSASVLDFESGLRAVALRSRLMQECCNNNPGTMAAIIGLTLERVGELINGIDGVVPANYNSPDQVAISGTLEGVDRACRMLKEAGAARTVKLAVGGAYHSPLMAHAGEHLAEFLDSLEFGGFDFPVIANVTGQPVKDQKEMKKLLKQQITSPVLWYPTLKYMSEHGVEQFREIGPGKVLQGLLKRSLKGRTFVSGGIDTAEDVKTAIGVTV